MHMNWLEISIGIVFLICIITGLVRGAIRIMVSLIATIVTFVIVFFATPYVSQTVEKYTPLDDMIKQKVVSTMADAATSDIVNGKIDSSDLAKYGISANVLDGLTGGSGSSVENVIENADIPESLQETMIKSADIPEVFKNLLLKNNNKEMYDELGVTTFPQYIGAYVARLVINIIAFILTFIVVTVIIRAVVFALDIVSELPVIGFFNHLAGGALGIGIALIIVWILFMIVTLMYTTAVGKEIYEMVQNNSILKLIYDCNPIMQLAVKLI